MTDHQPVALLVALFAVCAPTGCGGTSPAAIDTSTALTSGAPTPAAATPGAHSMSSQSSPSHSAVALQSAAHVGDDPQNNLKPRLLMRLRDGSVVTGGSVLRSGDKFDFSVRLARPSYLYVLQFYDHGPMRIYPPPGPMTIHPAGVTRVPGNRRTWFELDDNTGRETLYFLISDMPIASPGQYIEKQLGAVQRSPVRVVGRLKPAAPAPGIEPRKRRSSPRQGAGSRAKSLPAKGPAKSPGDVVERLPGGTSVDTRGVFISTEPTTDIASANGRPEILHITIQHRDTRPVARQ